MKNSASFALQIHWQLRPGEPRAARLVQATEYAQEARGMGRDGSRLRIRYSVSKLPFPPLEYYRFHRIGIARLYDIIIYFRRALYRYSTRICFLFKKSLWAFKTISHFVTVCFDRIGSQSQTDSIVQVIIPD